jgi:hypothetical protein
MIHWDKFLLKYMICVLVLFTFLIVNSFFKNAHDAVLGFLFCLLIGLPIFIFIVYIKRMIMRIFTKIPQDPDDVIKYIIYEKSFLIDLSTIIEEEGGIYLFLKKIKPRSNPALHTNEYHEVLILDIGYKSKYWIENVSNNETSHIIDKIISTGSVKEYLKKYKMDNWDNYIGNHIYLFITKIDFQFQFAKLLSNVGLDEGISRPEMTTEQKNFFWDIDQNDTF